MSVRFYNPREASAETLESMLVGRGPLLAELLEDLRQQATSESRQHWLLRGPRGIGKTHLLGVLYHRVRRDPALSAEYLPVWLPESEAYTVYSTGMLLLQVAEQLVEEVREVDGDAAAEIQDGLAELPPEGDDPVLFEEAAQLLKQAAASRGRILLVLMENLDAMLAGFRGGREARRFRALLSEDKELLFVSSTPTRYLRHLSDPRQPLYGHLRERTLEPLTEEEVGELFERYQEATGREVTLGQGGEARMRRRVLHRLTGGNPRAVIMAFSVLKGASGLRAMVEEMSALLDAQTAYFEARLSQLAPRERSIVAAMALASENLTLQEIATATRLPKKSLSTQVKRLVEEGHLAPTYGSGGKGTIYELSDGLFRIWYQYRKGKKRLEPLVHFLALWHSPEELEKTLADLFSIAEGPGSPFAVDLLETTARQIQEALRFARSPVGEAERERLWGEVWVEEGKEIDRLFKEVVETARQGDTERIAAIDVELSRVLGQESCPEPLRLQVLIASGLCKAVQGNSGDTLRCFEEFENRLGEAAAGKLLPLALFFKARALRILGQTNEAASTLRQSLALGDHWSKEMKAAVLLELAQVFDQEREIPEAIRHYREVLASGSEKLLLRAQGLLARALIVSAPGWISKGQPEEGIRALEEAIRYLKSRHEADLRVLLFVACTVLVAALVENKREVAQELLKEALAAREGIREIAGHAGPLSKVLLGATGVALATHLRLQGRLQEAASVLAGLPLQEFQVFTEHVQRVFEAAVPKTGSSGAGRAAGGRSRRAVARVPPEMRGLVKEVAERIHQGQLSEQLFQTLQLAQRAAKPRKTPSGATSSGSAE